MPGELSRQSQLDGSDPRVQGVVAELIVDRGLSYVDAIAACERAAEEVAAPYLAAARLIRAELERIDA